MSSDRPIPISATNAKARFSELMERVGRGERFVVSRRGKPAVALVPAHEVGAAMSRRAGLLTIVGALSDIEGFDQTIDEISASRRRSRDRAAPDLG